MLEAQLERSNSVASAVLMKLAYTLYVLAWRSVDTGIVAFWLLISLERSGRSARSSLVEVQAAFGPGDNSMNVSLAWNLRVSVR